MLPDKYYRRTNRDSNRTNKMLDAFSRLENKKSTNIKKDEEIISQDAELSYFYVQDVIYPRRFILGESEIINSYLKYNYVSYVLCQNTPWNILYL